VCSWFDCLILVKMWFQCGFCVLHERTVVSTGFLAQVSLPCLGEISRGSPRSCCSICRLDEEFYCWARSDLAQARRDSLERDLTKSAAPLLEFSPRRDGARLSERTSLAWVGPVRLSETGGKLWYYYWMVHWCVIAYLI